MGPWVVGRQWGPQPGLESLLILRKVLSLRPLRWSPVMLEGQPPYPTLRLLPTPPCRLFLPHSAARPHSTLRLLPIPLCSSSLPLPGAQEAGPREGQLLTRIKHGPLTLFPLHRGRERTPSHPCIPPCPGQTSQINHHTLPTKLTPWNPSQHSPSGS